MAKKQETKKTKVCSSPGCTQPAIAGYAETRTDVNPDGRFPEKLVDEFFWCAEHEGDICAGGFGPGRRLKV